MARELVALQAFNRGLISDLALARTDLKRTGLSAAIMTNWMPRVLGPMMLRPGLQYIGASRSNAAARFISFIPAINATSILEFTDGYMRVWTSDVLLTRPSVSTTVANGGFDIDLSSWTDSDEGGATSAWVAGGYMGLTGNGTAAAIRDQQVTVAVADRSVEHALRIVVAQGIVTLRVGSTSGGDDYINETGLAVGHHSLAFTPTGDFHIRMMSRMKRISLVNSCNVESAGVVQIDSPFGAANLDNIRGDPDSQSADVLFIGCSGFSPRKVERRAARSWSLVYYQPDDGPFRTMNTSTLTLTPSVLSGNGTLTASRAFFRSTHAPGSQNDGALFRVTSTGQTRTVTVTAQNQFSSAISITGVGTDRAFSINIDTVGAGTTIVLQRSLDSDTGPWSNVASKSWTAGTAESFNDTLDNQIVWYRIGCETGSYGAGTSVCTLQTAFGSITGVARVTSYTSSTAVAIEVLSDFGATSASDDWAEGRWSNYRGWPTAGTFAEGRLWWGGYDRLQGSISDDFAGFDPETEGDSGPIDRSIGSGPLTTINWLLPLQRLVLGAETAEYSCKSSSLDEPLTPTNLSIKSASTQGSAAVAALKIDKRGVYVQRGGTRVMELALGEDYEYESTDLTQLVPEIGQPQVVRLAVQRQPDTRIHCVRSDGTVAIAVFDRTENVLCWVELETDGSVEDVAVLPGAVGSPEDQVYYLVNRTINGSTVRYLEKWAKESECQGGTTNKQADSFVTFTNAPASATVTGLSHLVGESVVCWFDGKCEEDADGDPQTYTVSASGTITLGQTATTGVVGLPYTAPWKSVKLARAVEGLTQVKNMSHLSIIAKNMHHKGLKYGPTFDDLDDLPQVNDGETIAADTVHATYDTEPFEFDGRWESDARLCLQAQAPRPVTLLAAAFPVETNPKT